MRGLRLIAVVRTWCVSYVKVNWACSIGHGFLGMAARTTRDTTMRTLGRSTKSKSTSTRMSHMSSSDAMGPHGEFAH